MKAPATADEVDLIETPRGDWAKNIGDRKFYWPKARGRLAAANSAWEKMKEWDNRPSGCKKWADLETAARVADYGQRTTSGYKQALETVERNPPTLAASKQGISIAAALALYLEGMEKRVGLIGSLGIAEYTYNQNSHKVQRALGFLPSNVTHLSELDRGQLEALIYLLAARPSKKPNPLASKEVQTEQTKQHVSQATVLGWIAELKAFLLWAVDEGFWALPKHVAKLWNIKPQADEQKITVVTKEQLTALWHGAINDNAHIGDKGERRRLFLMLGLNCGFYGIDIATLKAEHITEDGCIWKLRQKTRKSNRKLVKTKWKLWAETKELLAKYMPLDIAAQDVSKAITRLTKSAKVSGISHANLRRYNPKLWIAG